MDSFSAAEVSTDFEQKGKVVWVKNVRKFTALDVQAHVFRPTAVADAGD